MLVVLHASPFSVPLSIRLDVGGRCILYVLRHVPTFRGRGGRIRPFASHFYCSRWTERQKLRSTFLFDLLSVDVPVSAFYRHSAPV